MKTIPRSLASTLVRLVMTCLLFVGTGWTLRGAATDAKTSFDAVTKHLDRGGSLYLYLSTEAWLQDLSTRIGAWRKMFENMPGMPDNERALVNSFLNVATDLVKNSGVEDVTGVGVSGILRPDNLYYTKFVVHHYPGRGKGFMWSLLGTEPHPLKTLDYLPINTVVANSADLDLAMLWKIIEEEVQGTRLAPAGDAINHVKQLVQSQTGMELEQILSSLGGSFTFVLTLDPEKKISVPAGPTPIKIPEPRLAIMLKVKDDTLFNILDKPLQKQEQVVKVDKEGLRMRTMPLPLPLPVRPTIAQTKEYLILASTEGLVEEMLATAAGERPGLRTTDEFKRLAESIPMEGNQFSFVGKRFGAEVNEIMRNVVKQHEGQNGPPPEFFEAFFNASNVAFGVTRNTEEGLIMTANQTQHPGMLLAGPVLIVPVAVMAGVALPALAKAKARAQTISCVNNLKQVALAGRIYANDHNNHYPKTFAEMKDELVNPKVLVCPGDQGHPPASDWDHFDLEKNVTYEFVAPGAADDDPDVVVFRCPVHGNEAMADGSVHQQPNRQ